MEDENLSAEQATPDTVDTETVTTEETSTETTTESKVDDKPTGAPESYEDLTVPDGFVFDKESANEFTAVAKELNLNQEQAQKLVDMYGAKMLGQLESQQQQVEQWTTESKKSFKPAEIDLANKTIGKFADKEFIDLLGSTGLGNHPQMIKLFKNIGSQLSEGNFVQANTSNVGKSAAQVLYPDHK